MPKVLERCRQHVMASGKTEKESWKICSKSTGWKRAGKHKWKKGKEVYVSEATLLKISNLLEESTAYEDGLFIGVNLDPGGLKKIFDIFKKMGFRNLLPINKAHITVINSKKPPKKDFKPLRISGIVEPHHFEILGGIKGKPFLLALVFKSKDLQRAHDYYLKEFGLHSGFKEYKPHLSIVYDIDRLLPGVKLRDKRTRQSVENMFNLLIKDLPKQIRILNEYHNERKEHWAPR